jgi:hypothetical protein
MVLMLMKGFYRFTVRAKKVSLRGREGYLSKTGSRDIAWIVG